jgi:hypothetical protein
MFRYFDPVQVPVVRDLSSVDYHHHQVESINIIQYSRLRRLCLSIGSEGPITTIDITG